MVLGKLPVLGRPTSWLIVGQGLTVLAVAAGGGCLDPGPPTYESGALPIALRGPAIDI